MKTINLAIPVLLAAALAVSACSKSGEPANTLTVSDVTLNDEDAVGENSFDNSADLSSDNIATADSLVAANATANAH